jgi:hypothetical protein
MVATLVTFKPSVNAMLLRDKSDPRNIYTVVPKGALDGPLSITCRINNQDINLETPKPFLIYPSIIEFSPLSGSAGVPVTITGYSFSPVAAENIVSFNGAVATVISASTTELIAEVPAGFSTGPVSVTVNGKTVTGPVFSLAEPGTPVIYTLSPRSGPAGSRVQITGTDFGATPGANTVKFGGNATANIVSASDTRIVVDVPAGAQSGQVTVTKEGKTGVGPTFTVTSDLVAFISSIEPAGAPRNGEFTIKGGNFNKDAPDFLVMNRSEQFFTTVSVTPQEIVARVPANYSLGSHTLFVFQGDHLSNGVPFEVTATPVIATLSVSDGLTGAILTINGSGFNPDETKNVVKFNDIQAPLVNPGDSQDDGKVSVYVPTIDAGVYSITVTAFGKTSNAMNFTVKSLGVPIPPIIYTEYYSDPNHQPEFRINRRSSDPPSQSTLYSIGIPSAQGTMNVVAVDQPRSRLFYVRERTDIARLNLNGTDATTVYPMASWNGGAIYDLTLDTQNQKIYYTDGDEGGTVFSGSMDGSAEVGWVTDVWTVGIVAYGMSYVPEKDLLYICGYYSPSTAVMSLTTDGVTSEVLFDGANDGLIGPLDMKIDVTSQKIFILDGRRTIKVGNLDGTGSLTTLVTRSQNIIGVAVDAVNQYVYWMEFSAGNAKRASVFRARYDHTDIPGTNPLSPEQEVYTDIYADSGAGGLAGLALDGDTGSGSSQRGAFSFSALKMKRMMNSANPLLLKNKSMKKARPGK